MPTINYYQRKIAEYRKRRQMLRTIYMGTPLYRKKSRNLSTKIKLWSVKLKRLQTGVKKASDVDKLICEYFGFSVRSLSKFSNNIVKSIFYKYCIEHGIKSKFAALYVRLDKPNQPGLTRLSFTRSFASKPENRAAYHNFLGYVRRSE